MAPANPCNLTTSSHHFLSLHSRPVIEGTPHTRLTLRNLGCLSAKGDCFKNLLTLKKKKHSKALLRRKWHRDSIQCRSPYLVTSACSPQHSSSFLSAPQKCHAPLYLVSIPFVFTLCQEKSRLKPQVSLSQALPEYPSL